MNTRSQRKTSRPSHHSGFNMVEIAICLAVIGIALVAIVGVMPTGMRASQDNREETIIDQDARYFIQAIRSGAGGSTNMAYRVWMKDGSQMNSMQEIIGYICKPGNNEIVVRSFSGPAAERSPSALSVAFGYQLTTQVAQVSSNGYLHEVSLRFDWPITPSGGLGTRRGTGSPRIYRMVISGQLVLATNSNNEVFAFFRP